MIFNRKISITLFTLLLIVQGLILPGRSNAFPLRIGEDCFYGEGEPSGDGMSSWMGYAVEFEPPYTPYTLDSISIYISDMRLANGEKPPKLKVSVIDGMGILWQKCEVEWSSLDGFEGWVIIGLSESQHEYDGKFTVIVHSGLLPGYSSYVPENPDAIFRLGIDETDDTERSYWYTSNDPPVRGSNMGGLAESAELTKSKLVTVSNGNPLAPEYPGGNWMIRAHAPGLQIESTHILITNESINERFSRPGIPEPDWYLPPIEGFGPRNTVHCPTSLAGITFYYHEGNRAKKFLIPHDGPWVNTELIRTLGAMCEELYREGVIGIEHIGIYNDRNIYGTNVKSSHAYGLGIDISGFEYADGRTYLVEDHDDPEVRAVLEYIRDTYLTKYFPSVLDWHYQRHDNHFHVNLPYPQ